MTRRWLRQLRLYCNLPSTEERGRADARGWCVRSRRVVLRLVRVLGQPVRALVNSEQACAELAACKDTSKQSQWAEQSCKSIVELSLSRPRTFGKT